MGDAHCGIDCRSAVFRSGSSGIRITNATLRASVGGNANEATRQWNGKLLTRRTRDKSGSPSPTGWGVGSVSEQLGPQSAGHRVAHSAALSIARIASRIAGGSVGQASITVSRSGVIGAFSRSTAPDFAPAVSETCTRLGENGFCSIPAGGTWPSRRWSRPFAFPGKTEVFWSVANVTCQSVRGKTAGCCSALCSAFEKWSSVTCR
mgnify:CR=1 FL=1